MSESNAPKAAADSGSEFSPEEIRQALVSIERGMRMLSKAIHRFHELRAVHQELRYDVEWTNYLVQLRQSIEGVSKIIRDK